MKTSKSNALSDSLEFVQQYGPPSEGERDIELSPVDSIKEVHCP